MSRWTVRICGVVFAIASVACSETDAGVTTKVKAKFAADDVVKAYQIDVDTERKVVTLTGNVDSAAAKNQAVRLARGTEGVTNVVDKLKVTTTETPSSPDTRADVTDAGITAAIKTKFLADTAIAGLKIDVDTKNGVVTLTGPVKTAAERAEAIRLARETTGVKTVIDRLTMGS